MAWDKQVPGCFAGNLIFTSHPAEEERAFAWLIDLRKRKIGWKAARAQLGAFLNSQRAEAGHIQRELDRAEALLKPWLLD